MKVLVTGGAGYIGSVCVEQLLNAGHQVTVFDHLEQGHRAAVDPRAEFIEGSLSSPESIAAANYVYSSMPEDRAAAPRPAGDFTAFDEGIERGDLNSDGLVQAAVRITGAVQQGIGRVKRKTGKAIEKLGRKVRNTS